MSDNWVDFKDIKAKVTMEMVLGHSELTKSVKGCRFQPIIDENGCFFVRQREQEQGSDMSSGYEFLGQLLRFPVFLLGCFFWSVYVFPFILFFAVVCTVGQPLIFPVLYVLAFVLYAFAGEKEPPSFQGYWDDYPARYMRWLKTGWGRMYVWFVTGE